MMNYERFFIHRSAFLIHHFLFIPAFSTQPRPVTLSRTCAAHRVDQRKSARVEASRKTFKQQTMLKPEPARVVSHAHQDRRRAVRLSALLLLLLVLCLSAAAQPPTRRAAPARGPLTKPLSEE